MAESKRTVSGNLGGKIVYLPTQGYDTPFVQFREFFVSLPMAEIDSIQTQKWNNKRVIFFQSVILQRVQLVTGAKNIARESSSKSTSGIMVHLTNL